jgi:hypothetical protein
LPNEDFPLSSAAHPLLRVRTELARLRAFLCEAPPAPSKNAPRAVLAESSLRSDAMSDLFPTMMDTRDRYCPGTSR